MTKEGYTYIIVPKELHAILKGEAEARGMSISRYIAMCINTESSSLNCRSPGRDSDPRSPPYQGGALADYATKAGHIPYHITTTLKYIR